MWIQVLAVPVVGCRGKCLACPCFMAFVSCLHRPGRIIFPFHEYFIGFWVLFFFPFCHILQHWMLATAKAGYLIGKLVFLPSFRNFINSWLEDLCLLLRIKPVTKFWGQKGIFPPDKSGDFAIRQGLVEGFALLYGNSLQCFGAWARTALLGFKADWCSRLAACHFSLLTTVRAELSAPWCSAAFHCLDPLLEQHWASTGQIQCHCRSDWVYEEIGSVLQRFDAVSLLRIASWSSCHSRCTEGSSLFPPSPYQISCSKSLLITIVDGNSKQKLQLSLQSTVIWNSTQKSAHSYRWVPMGSLPLVTGFWPLLYGIGYSPLKIF